MKSSRTPALLALAIALCSIALWGGPHGRPANAADSDRPVMTVGTPIPVPRAVGRFDYLAIDEKYRRLLAVHTSSNELLVFDIDTGEIERRVSVGPGHGVAIDVYDGRVFVGTEDGYISELNRRWLVEDQRIYTNGPVDAIAFDPRNGRLFADHADGSEVWVVQARTNKLLQFAVTIAKGPEYLEYDPVTDKIYQNVTSNNSVQVIDPGTNTVIATWPLAPATDPRGLAVDGKGKRLFSAGANGKLVILDLTTGQVQRTIEIPPRVDQIAYDAGANKLYCASGTGVLAVLGDTSEGFDKIGEVSIPRGAHTLAVDPKTHNVWIAYGSDQSDYVIKLSPPPAGSPSPSPGATPVVQGVVSGVVTYLQRSALSPTAVVHMEIDDVTLEDAPMVTISAVDIPVTHQVPIAFSLPYDPSKIDSKHHYALNARISDHATLLFLNKTRFPLFENGAPTSALELRVDPISP
jgi:YVTN family beta-propeller protein